MANFLGPRQSIGCRAEDALHFGQAHPGLDSGGGSLWRPGEEGHDQHRLPYQEGHGGPGEQQ
jgi:hypothetical protein